MKSIYYSGEIWKPIKGYEGLYEVSNLGRVKTLNYHREGREGILKQTDNRRGYLIVHLFIDGVSKTYLVHRLVAQAFLPSPQLDQTEVNHKNENKKDNRVENLEWCTPSYNINYGTHNQRAAEARGKQVLQFDKEGNFITMYPSIIDAKKQTGIAQQSICACCNGKRNSAGGFVWLYK